MDEEMSNSLRRMSTRTRKVAPKMAAALASSDNRTQAMLARLEALENDNAGLETVQVDEDDEASLTMMIKLDITHEWGSPGQSFHDEPPMRNLHA
ncbi:hypothetical protein DH2020_041045 [Rehmannia glutinosa]|uniref:Uncharacterized protein n=1 Tax=Rehmannia glutinosa TaxID=99300 RepID=A0ABR0URY8_REHGL